MMDSLLEITRGTECFSWVNDNRAAATRPTLGALTGGLSSAVAADRSDDIVAAARQRLGLRLRGLATGDRHLATGGSLR
jgi:hypothetical protein